MAGLKPMSTNPFVYGTRGALVAYATDDPQVAEVVAPNGLSERIKVMVLLKFGWELEEPLGWPNTDRFGKLNPGATKRAGDEPRHNAGFA